MPLSLFQYILDLLFLAGNFGHLLSYIDFSDNLSLLNKLLFNLHHYNICRICLTSYLTTLRLGLDKVGAFWFSDFENWLGFLGVGGNLICLHAACVLSGYGSIFNKENKLILL